MELLSEFVSFLLQSIFWYFVISLVVAYFQHKTETKNQEVKEQFEKLNHLIHRVTVEKHNEVYYWYDADDDEFLGQGKTTEEAVEQIRKRFPGHVFLVADKERNYRLSGPEWKLQPFNLPDLKT